MVGVFSGDFWVPEGKNRGLWDSKHASNKVQLKKLGGRFTRHVDDWLVGTIFFLMTRFELAWKACWISQPMVDQFGGPLFFGGGISYVYIYIYTHIISWYFIILGTLLLIVDSHPASCANRFHGNPFSLKWRLQLFPSINQGFGTSANDWYQE
jgi:hypothetical protein